MVIMDNILPIVLLASLFISAIVSLSVLGSASYLQLTLPIYLASFLVVYMAYSVHKERLKRAGIIEGIMNGVSRVVSYQSAKMPLANAINKASRFCANKHASNVLLESSSRIKMGESLFDSLVSSAKDGKIGKEIARYIRGPDSGASEASLLYGRIGKERSMRRSALSARYATIGMFISTIAPSFAIFSFIGGMMITPANSNILFLSVSLTAAIPAAFAAMNVLSER